MEIFRDNSLKKLSGPEQLDDYIHVVDLPAWMIVGAIILVIAIFVIWGFLGNVDGVSPIQALFGK